MPKDLPSGQVNLLQSNGVKPGSLRRTNHPSADDSLALVPSKRSRSDDTEAFLWQGLSAHLVDSCADRRARDDAETPKEEARIRSE